MRKYIRFSLAGLGLAICLLAASTPAQTGGGTIDRGKRPAVMNPVVMLQIPKP